VVIEKHLEWVLIVDCHLVIWRGCRRFGSKSFFITVCRRRRCWLAKKVSHRFRRSPVVIVSGVSDRQSITYLLKFFFFAAFSFCDTGVTMLSVGDTKEGLLTMDRVGYSIRHAMNSLALRHFLCQQSLCTQTWRWLSRRTVCRVP
jgi:hypothetical protein